MLQSLIMILKGVYQSNPSNQAKHFQFNFEIFMTKTSLPRVAHKKEIIILSTRKRKKVIIESNMSQVQRDFVCRIKILIQNYQMLSFNDF